MMNRIFPRLLLAAASVMMSLNAVAQSSGLGLNYIRQQYRDRSGKGIEIIRTDDFYKVKLPLL